MTTAVEEISRKGAKDAKPQLPDDWCLVKLGEVCEEKTGVRDPCREPDKSFRYVDITSVDNKAKRIGEAKLLFGKDAPSRARHVIRSGDVIVSTTRPNLNAVALIPPELDEQICSTGFCVLRATPDLNSDYLFGFVQTADFVESLSELVKGALYPAVTDDQVREQIIPLPPLAEQKRIAGILKEQMAAVERARRGAEAQLQAAEALPAAHLRAVFENGESNSWPRVNIGSITSLVIDGPHVTPTYESSGIPFLTVRNIVNRRIDLSNVSFISPIDHAGFVRRGKPERGDILYTKDGTLGIPCLVETDLEFNFFVSVALIKLLRNRAFPQFIAFALESPSLIEQVRRLAAGAGLKHMVLRSIRALEVPLPPLSDQRRIAAQLSTQMAAAERLRQTLAEQLDAINKLPAALLREAFSGRV